MNPSATLYQELSMKRIQENSIRWLWLILFIGLLLRLLYATDLPTVLLFRHGGGGDSGWYLANGAGFFSGKEHGYIRGIAYYISNLPTPPFYIIFAGVFQTFMPKHESRGVDSHRPVFYFGRNSISSIPNCPGGRFRHARRLNCSLVNRFASDIYRRIQYDCDRDLLHILHRDGYMVSISNISRIGRVSFPVEDCPSTRR